METYCIKEEMDKQGTEEYHLEITERQYERISQKDIEYTDFLCYILERTNWNYDISIIKGNEWNRFYNSDDEDDEMEMVIVGAKDFYERFKEISKVDLMSEKCFVSMTYIDNNENDVELIVSDNGINKRFVIGIVG